MEYELLQFGVARFILNLIPTHGGWLGAIGLVVVVGIWVAFFGWVKKYNKTKNNCGLCGKVGKQRNYMGIKVMRCDECYKADQEYK